jgi:hypothetical protein
MSEVSIQGSAKEDGTKEKAITSIRLVNLFGLS